MLCRAPSIFSNSFSTSFFTFVRKVMMIFLTKIVFPILPISPHDVISFLHPFGQQDKRNGRWQKIEEAEEMMALRARYHFNPRVPSGTDKTRNKTEEKQEITFLNNFSLFLLHFLFVLLLSQKSDCPAKIISQSSPRFFSVKAFMYTAVTEFFTS